MNSIRDRKAAIKKLKTLVYSTKQELEDFRKTLDKTFYTPILPNGVECIEKIKGHTFEIPELLRPAFRNCVQD